MIQHGIPQPAPFDPDTLQVDYLYKPGLAGGQFAFGGIAAGDALTFQGSAFAGDSGFINFNSPIQLDYNTFDDAQQFAMVWNTTAAVSASYIGGCLQTAATFNIATGVFIPAIFSDTNQYNVGAAPGFSAITFINELSIVRNNGNFSLPSALVINVGLVHERNTAGTSTTPGATGLSFSAQTRATVSGAVMTKTDQTAVRCSPTFSTVLGSTVNLGTVRGLHCFAPAVSLFQPASGFEAMTAYYGVDVNSINFGGNVPKAALRSNIAPASNARFLLNNGNAISEFGAGHIYFDDNAGIVYGGTIAAWDVWQSWNSGSGGYFRTFFLSTSTALRWTSPAANRFLFDNDGGSTTGEYNFNCAKFSFGAQTGNNGNQVGSFTTPARTVGVAGGWADFLLTQGGNLNIGTFSMSDVAAWAVNAISLANTAGSITSLDTFVVGGMTTSNPGVTVTERSAIRVAGRSKLSGSVQYPPIDPAALSAGDNDDWAGLLTGSPNNNGRYWARITGNATTSNITGIDATAVQDGDSYEITNVGTENILIFPDDAGSAAANRILTVDSFNHVLKPDGTVTVRYDTTSSRWRVTTPAGNVAPLTGFWRFSTTTAMADPGAGTFRANNATPASITAFALSDISFQGGDVSAVLALIAAGDVMYLSQSNDGSRYVKFDVSGTTDNGTWFQIDGTVSDSGTLFGNNQECAITTIFA